MTDDKLDMDADEYVVIAPYVTLRVKGELGSFIVRGYLEGGVVKGADIDPDSLRHHLEGDMVAPVGSDAAKFAAPSGTPKPGEPPNVPVTETPVATLPLAERLQAQHDADDKTQADAKAAKKAAPAAAKAEAAEAKADAAKADADAKPDAKPGS